MGYKTKTRYFLLVLTIPFFFTVNLLTFQDPYILNENFIPPHPSGCLPQVENELRGDKPKIYLQHNREANELWKLLHCCATRTKSSERFCGRYGCCSITCYSDIQSEILNLSSSNSAFFLETSGAPSLNHRQACSLESLAKHNPNLTIHLLLTSEKIDFEASTSRAILENYANVRFESLYPLGEYFTGTPLEHWYFCSGWNYGPYAISHLSDALRFLTLFKFGGYYFDSDIIFIRQLPENLKNFVAYQNDYEIAAGSIHINKGHSFSELAVEEFATGYKADDWTRNGPDVVLRTMERLCKNNTLEPNQFCQGITTLSRDSFYPIPWQSHYKYFQELKTLPNLTTDLDGAVFGAHVWNKYSGKSLARKKWHKTQLYTHLAFENCPNVFKMAPETF